MQTKVTALMMRTTRTIAALCVLGACLVLSACGDDEPTTTITTPTGKAAASAEASPTKEAERTPEADATKAPEADRTPKPEKTVEGLPSSTPEPGPPATFGAVISPAGIEVDTKTVESGPSLEVTLANSGKKLVPITLTANGVTVASGQIEGGAQTVAQVRNLDPGKLVFKSGKLKTTVKVVDEE